MSFCRLQVIVSFLFYSMYQKVPDWIKEALPSLCRKAGSVTVGFLNKAQSMQVRTSTHFQNQSFAYTLPSARWGTLIKPCSWLTCSCSSVVVFRMCICRLQPCHRSYVLFVLSLVVFYITLFFLLLLLLVLFNVALCYPL